MGISMKGIRFERVSKDEYIRTCKAYNPEMSDESLEKEWEEIKLPQRSTEGSAGYDFFMPRKMQFYPHQGKFFPTGIRALMPQGCVLLLVPKSGLGCRHGMRLLNTIGVVDSDYSHSDNEGHIMAGVEVSRELLLCNGEKFMQGVFVPYLITEDDNASGDRNGGFGSTGSE